MNQLLINDRSPEETRSCTSEDPAHFCDGHVVLGTELGVGQLSDQPVVYDSAVVISLDPLFNQLSHGRCLKIGELRFHFLTLTLPVPLQAPHFL
jgi:hypothetical protein